MPYKATARKTKWGYKAVIVHPSGYTEILARRFALSQDGTNMVQRRAGKNFDTREQAVAFAQRTIAFREQKRTERVMRYVADMEAAVSALAE